jgi:transketolase
VELVTLLYFKYLRADLDQPQNPANDRVIFSKGHASALFYSLYGGAGKLTEEELMKYRTFDSPLEGHPTSRFPFTEAATGSLGQGLSIGVGEAWAMRKRYQSVNVSEYQGKNPDTLTPDTLTHHPYVFVLLGDGELAEGSNWEAAAWASKQKLSNIVAIVDLNGFGQSDETMYGHDASTLERRFTAFGWTTLVIDGHDFNQIDAAYQKASDHRDGPVAIIAKTIKGKGIPYWEDKNGWHNKMLPKEEYEKALKIFETKEVLKGEVKKPEDGAYRGSSFDSSHQGPDRLDVHQDINAKAVMGFEKTRRTAPVYKSDEIIATKKAFGNAIERLGSVHPELYLLDGDVSNSLHTDQFKKTFPDRFLQMYIAEQNMVGVATGLAKQGLKPFVATFACFLTRAHDQIRLLPLSGVTVYFTGSYVGVSLGKDGPSQMGLEDIAMFRSIHGSTVLYPSDPYQTERLVEGMLKTTGVVYIRTTREPTPVIYSSTDTFPIGGSKVFEPSNQVTNNQVITIVAAGITVHEALKAQKQLESEGIAVRVIDCYSIKPIDGKTLKKAAADSSQLIVVEDHYPEGGLGEAVLSALGSVSIPLVYLAVHKLPRSGNAGKLLAFEGIDSKSIIKAVKKF